MSRERWLEEGTRVLAQEGAPGVKIDRVAARLGLSKGSFFHHFDGIADYRRAILVRWEQQALSQLEEAPPQAALEGLAARVGDLVDLPLEAAVRAWSTQDRDAAAAQERVDRARFAALESIWVRLVDDPARAHAAALLPHLLLIGVTVARPPTSRADLEAAFGLLAELIPVVSSAEPAGKGA